MIYKPLTSSGAISAGNGAAMRISPLGIFYWEDIDKLLKATIDASLITHRDIRGIAAAGLISYTVSYLIDKSPDEVNWEQYFIDLKIFISELENTIVADYATIQHTSISQNQVSKSIDILQDISNASYETATDTLDKWASQHSEYRPTYHNSPFALGSVLFSLYLFISQGLDWEKAVLAAVNAGGDADTIGAMVGTICGALHGYNKIPPHLLRALYNQKTLQQLGESLINCTSINDDLIAIEKSLCKKENEFRQQYRQMINNSLGFN